MFRVKFIPLYNDNDPPYYVRSLNHSWRRGVRLVESSSAAVRLPCISPGKSLSSSEREREREREDVSVSRKIRRYHELARHYLPSLRERKCRAARATLFFPLPFRFLTSLPHLHFYRSYWRHPAVRNVFPISVTGFCDMTNAAQINRVHYFYLLTWNILYTQ